jgi:hypothetical protein
MEEMHNFVILGFAGWTPETPRKNPDTPESLESLGFPTPEFPGFIPETLIHNAAQIDHPNSEIK